MDAKKVPDEAWVESKDVALKGILLVFLRPLILMLAVLGRVWVWNFLQAFSRIGF